MKLKIFLVIITLSNTLYAQLPENIDLEADNIIFQKNNHLLQATSNVILSYENLTTYTENFIYDTKLLDSRPSNRPGEDAYRSRWIINRKG